MKKCFPILLAIWPYLFFFIATVVKEDSYGTAFLAYFILTVLVYASNVIYACKCQGENADYRLAFWEMVLKLAHIPFYLIVMAVSVLLTFSIVVPALLLMSPIIIFFLMMIDFFLMATTSVYGVNALVRAKRKGTVTGSFSLIHILLHFIFVLDVISSIFVFIQIRKQKKRIAGGAN